MHMRKGLLRHGARVILQNIDYLPVSSTMVREAVRQGRSIDALVHRGSTLYPGKTACTSETESKKEAVNEP